MGAFVSYDVGGGRHDVTSRRRRRKRAATAANSNRPASLVDADRGSAAEERSRMMRTNTVENYPSHDPTSTDDDDDNDVTTTDQTYVYYRLSAFGLDFRFNLSRSEHLLAPTLTVEYWNRNGPVRRHSYRRDCFYVGHVIVTPSATKSTTSSSKSATSRDDESSRVAVSNCNGLVSLL